MSTTTKYGKDFTLSFTHDDDDCALCKLRKEHIIEEKQVVRGKGYFSHRPTGTCEFRFYGVDNKETELALCEALKNVKLPQGVEYSGHSMYMEKNNDW